MIYNYDVFLLRHPRSCFLCLFSNSYNFLLCLYCASDVDVSLPIWLWPLISNSGGVDGRDGEKGEEGWPGERGDRGMTGPQGMEEGEKGDTGDKGMKGNTVSVDCKDT